MYFSININIMSNFNTMTLDVIKTVMHPTLAT